jgi:hypothetical protein
MILIKRTVLDRIDNFQGEYGFVAFNMLTYGVSEEKCTPEEEASTKYWIFKKGNHFL